MKVKSFLSVLISISEINRTDNQEWAQWVTCHWQKCKMRRSYFGKTMDHVKGMLPWAVNYTFDETPNYSKLGFISVFNLGHKLVFCSSVILNTEPENFFLSKVNNRNIRKMYEISLKLAIKTSEQRHWRRFCCWLWAGKCLLGIK